MSKIDPKTGTVAATVDVSAHCTDPISLIAISSDPGSLAFGSLSSSLWVTCNAAGNGPQVVELDSSGVFVTGTLLQGKTIGNSPYNLNMAFDGLNVWLTTASTTTGASVTAINTTNFNVTPFSLAMGSSPVAVAFDGVYIWVANNNGAVPSVTRLLPATGATQSYPTNAGNAYLVAFDGGNIWVSTPNPNLTGLYTLSKM